MYLDRDGDVWAVRDSDGAAVNVVFNGDTADDVVPFRHAFNRSRVEEMHGPLRPLVVAAPDPTVLHTPSLADVLASLENDLRSAYCDAPEDSPEEAVYRRLFLMFERAHLMVAEGGDARG